MESKSRRGLHSGPENCPKLARRFILAKQIAGSFAVKRLKVDSCAENRALDHAGKIRLDFC
jgi:hypothetical protein